MQGRAPGATCTSAIGRKAASVRNVFTSTEGLGASARGSATAGEAMSENAEAFRAESLQIEASQDRTGATITLKASST